MLRKKQLSKPFFTKKVEYRGSSPYANFITAKFVAAIFQKFQIYSTNGFFWPKYFITAILIIKPDIQKIAVMKYFGPKNSLAKYLANVKFG